MALDGDGRLRVLAEPEALLLQRGPGLGAQIRLIEGEEDAVADVDDEVLGRTRRRAVRRRRSGRAGRAADPGVCRPVRSGLARGEQRDCGENAQQLHADRMSTRLHISHYCATRMTAST